MKELLLKVNALALEELNSSMEKFPLFNSEHEGYAVIKEEAEELQEEAGEAKCCVWQIWNHVRNNTHHTAISIDRLRQAALNAAAEAVQVVAMCEKWNRSFQKEGDRHSLTDNIKNT